ncbi:Dynein heavy chain [Diplonema papillatum]|nr:Dynein heavy chain [Diplonema papillatum]
MRVCSGDDKPTNHVREVMAMLSKGSIPPKWKRYTVHPMLTVSQWIPDFGQRCKNIEELGAVEPAQYTSANIDLGMLLFPGAFITATRQAVARALTYPLEKLMLSLDITEEASGAKSDANGGSFVITGLGLESCELRNGRLHLLNGKLRAQLRNHRLWWKKQDAHKNEPNSLELPLYLNPSRTEILAKVYLPMDPAVQEREWYQMGTAITAWQMP